MLQVPAVMYDSVTWESIPAGAELVAGYIDGDFPWPRAAWARFARARKVTITTRAPGDVRANVADVENGDFTPEQAAEWLRAKDAAGIHGGTIYCSLDSRDAVDAACQGLAYWQWLADWTGEAHELYNAVAVQYASIPSRYDLSTVYNQQWLEILDAANRPWPWG